MHISLFLPFTPCMTGARQARSRHVLVKLWQAMSILPRVCEGSREEFEHNLNP